MKARKETHMIAMLEAHAVVCRAAIEAGWIRPSLTIHDFRGVNLDGADLRGANLRDVDLRYATLRYAALRYADITGANLRYADITGADLRYADLCGSDLRDVRDLPLDDAGQAALRAAVKQQIENHPESLNQSSWHSRHSRRTHCVAGWTVRFAGPTGQTLESRYGTSVAAHLLLGGRTRPSFGVLASREEILDALRQE